MFAIPKASSVAHVEENAGAGDLRLDPSDVAAIDGAFPVGRRGRSRRCDRSARLDQDACDAARSRARRRRRARCRCPRRSPSRANACAHRSSAATSHVGLRRRIRSRRQRIRRTSSPARAASSASPCPTQRRRRCGRRCTGASRTTPGRPTITGDARTALRRGGTSRSRGGRGGDGDCLRHQADRRTRVCRARGPGLDRQAHEPDLPGARIVRVFGRDRHDAGARTRPSAAQRLRRVRALHRRVVPTGALRGDYTIDATRCIADLTQRTDPIPRAMRALIGDWVWGCDICQIVCPPTRNAAARGSAAFVPYDATTAAPALADTAPASQRRIQAALRAHGDGMARCRGLRRNAAVALGNALDRSAVPALTQSLRRSASDGARTRQPGRSDASARRGDCGLASASPHETEPSVLEEISAALL